MKNAMNSMKGVTPYLRSTINISPEGGCCPEGGCHA